MNKKKQMLEVKRRNAEVGIQKQGRGNWVLMFGLLVVGMTVFVGAATWEEAAYNVTYWGAEEIPYTHNLSDNVTGLAEGDVFEISPGIDKAPYIYWNDVIVDLVDIGDWIFIENSTTGNLIISAIYDNQTGAFRLPLRVTDGTGSTTKEFNFTVNATNDAPEFLPGNVESDYTFVADESLQTFFFNASDEENQFPLSFNVVFNETNCTHGADTGYADNENCSLFDFGLTLEDILNESSNMSFTPNSSHVGTYWANISVMDAANGSDCPHDWCDSDYNTANKTTYHSEMVKFTVSAILEVDVSNCTGATLMEDKQFNCTIEISTPGENDALNLSSNGKFRNDISSPDDTSWLYSDTNVNSSSFKYNVSISVIPSKVDVGNWTINFTTRDGAQVDITKILIYVNYTESLPNLSVIDNISLYENYTFEVNASDEDLLILDNSVKNSSLTFASNTTWVTFVDTTPTLISGNNYVTANVNVNHDHLNATNGNHSIKINITDDAGNVNSSVFTIEILNDVAPEWNGNLSDPVNLSLTEENFFTYNVSVNVSDADVDDNITFYYENVSTEFCSLTASNFNHTTGVIEFTPDNCDVGYHNVMIIASDGKLNSTGREFDFTVSNINDDPIMSDFKAENTSVEVNVDENVTIKATEDKKVTFTLTINDDDFLIPSGQKSFYNESLVINVTARNSNNTEVSLFDFLFVEIGADESYRIYNAEFTPNGIQTDNYTITVDITDNSSVSINRTFYLNVSEISNYPNLTAISNQSVTIHDYFSSTINATDDEDDRNNLSLSYSIVNLTVGAPNLTARNLTAGNGSGVIEFDMNSTKAYAGIWHYNVTVTDSDNQSDSEDFYLYTYGSSALNSPTVGDSFNLIEHNESTLNFTINHSVADNLTYEFWVDSTNCSYQNNSNCNYGSLILRETISSFGDGSVYGWEWTPNYTDETYGNEKNLTVRVYPNTINLNSTQQNAVATNFSFKLNISHANAPVYVSGNIPNPYPSATYGNVPITINLTSYFNDEDFLDSYYVQNVTFNISTSVSNSIIRAEENSVNYRLPWNGTIDNWNLQLYGEEAGSEDLIIYANDSVDSVSNGPFTITFTEPVVETVTTPSAGTSSGGGTTTKIKHFSLKLIVPQDVIISDMNYIDIPFTVQNNGQIDLRGINLNSFVRFNDEFSDDVKISLGDNYIELLKFGQSENFTMRILANTQRAGKYKATILANVTSPKFSDWGDFFIELKKTNESEAEQILIFTEKFISENPECLELTEILRRAEAEFLLGDYSEAMSSARQATEACEDAIVANEQIKYPVIGFVKDNFYYISFSTLIIFLLGFVFYVYKRVRFNKYKVDEYI